MDAKELVRRLNGIEIQTRIDKTLISKAKAAKLVIVYGDSDDLLEFEGAISDETGAFNGATVEVDEKGLIPNFDEINRHDKDELRAYFAREGKGRMIKAKWCPENTEYSWIIETDIPHETFEIVEVSQPFCRGIVFSLDDLNASKIAYAECSSEPPSITTPLKAMSRAIALQMQLRDFGHAIDDDNGGATFETTPAKIEALGAAADRAARAALLVLAECDLPEEAHMAGTAAGYVALDDVRNPTPYVFRAICRALAEENSK